MSPVVRDEDLLLVVDNNAVGELEVRRAVERVQGVSVLVEYDDPHHLALDDNDEPLVVNGDTARIAQCIGPELSHKLPVLVVDLDLVSGGAFRDDNIPAVPNHSNSVGVQQLAVAFATFTKLELESTFLIEDLYSVVVCISHDDIILGIHSDTTGFSKLTFDNTEFTKLCVINHLLPLDLGSGRERVQHIRSSLLHFIGKE